MDISNFKALKHDQDKVQLNLIDPLIFDELGKVLTYGAKKYYKENWRLPMEHSRYYAAALRHLCAYWGGNNVDPESGLPHLSHALCNIAFLLWHSVNRPEGDDRYVTRHID